jgi:hypothetical protein
MSGPKKDLTSKLQRWTKVASDAAMTFRRSGRTRRCGELSALVDAWVGHDQGPRLADILCVVRESALNSPSEPTGVAGQGSSSIATRHPFWKPRDGSVAET